MTTAEQFEALLPVVLRAGAAAPGPTAGLLDAMAALAGPRAALISRGGALFHPLTAPDAMLPYLAHWLGRATLFVDPADPRRGLALDDAFPLGAARLRLYLAAVPMLDDLRGSAVGLRLGLQIATARSGFAVDDNAGACHVTVTAPADLLPLAAWLGRLIAAERPAHLTWSLDFGEGEATP